VEASEEEQEGAEEEYVEASEEEQEGAEEEEYVPQPYLSAPHPHDSSPLHLTTWPPCTRECRYLEEEGPEEEYLEEEAQEYAEGAMEEEEEEEEGMDEEELALRARIAALEAELQQAEAGSSDAYSGAEEEGMEEEGGSGGSEAEGPEEEPAGDESAAEEGQEQEMTEEIPAPDFNPFAVREVLPRKNPLIVLIALPAPRTPQFTHLILRCRPRR